MKQEVIAVFDIGKTNKKLLLFDRRLKPVHQEEQPFEEVVDDDGFPCDDIARIGNWVLEKVHRFAHSDEYDLRAVNFATYGASLVYLDANGQRLMPVYNYLKPMPEDVLAGFYERYGGVEEFSRCTASPALGMLNSGLQILRFKKEKPQFFTLANAILHLPQYFSFLVSREIRSEYTSIGCHTAMWDFDHQRYHPWLADAGIVLPSPVANDVTAGITLEGKSFLCGTGIHDSSSSLVPYLKGSEEPFILASTGTWCIFMNPFNKEPLTLEQLRKDTLCYMSTGQAQVKSSRFFMGHIHDTYTRQISSFFNRDTESYKLIRGDEAMVNKLLQQPACFECDSSAVDGCSPVNLSKFSSYEEAYHRLIVDLTRAGIDSLRLVIPEKDLSTRIYITGGFARNELFMRLLATLIPGKKVFASETDNATALGAAMAIFNKVFPGEESGVDLGLKEIEPFRLRSE